MAKGLPARDVAYSAPIEFVRNLGLSDADADRILRDNPREFITIRESK